MKILIFLILLSGGSAWLTESNFNVTLYETMPKLYQMDNFEECADTISPIFFKRQFCIISVHVEDKNNPKLMKEINTFSSKNKRTHFQHAELRYGVCFSKCLKLHAHLKDDYEKYLTNNKTVLDKDLFEVKRVLLNKLANVCINKELQDLYGLKGTTEVDYCTHEVYDVEPVERYFALVLLVHFLNILLATIFDKYQNHQRISKYFDNWRRVKNYILSYSITRNWKILFATNANEDEDAARFNIFRTEFLFFFVFVQVYRNIVSMPFANPIHVERGYQHFSSYIYNEESVVNSFFTKSGLYLSLHFIPAIKNSQIRAWKQIVNLFSRYQEQTFSLIAFTLFTLLTIFPHLSEAPFWKHVTVGEWTNCRENWRYNVLNLQNYNNRSGMCMEPTWILAAELHLVVVGFVILLLSVKFPRFSKAFFGLALISSFGIVAFKSFQLQLQPVAIITAESLRHNFLTTDEKFHEFYYPTHMNAGNFIIGLLFGYLIHNKTQIWNITRHTISLTLILFLVPAAFKYYFTLNYVKPSIGTALLGAYLKHHEGIFLSLILYNVLHRERTGKHFKWLSHPIFQVLDKLFIPAFFCQLLVTKYFIANTRVLLEVSTLNMFSYTCGIMIVSYVMAVIVQLVFQAPYLNKVGYENVVPQEKDEKKKE